MRKWLGLSVLFILTTHCSFFHKDPIVLQINSKKWTAKEFSKLLAQKTLNFSVQDVKDQQVLDKIKNQIIGDLIIQEIIQNWAAKNNIKISEKELTQELQKMTQQYPSEAAFQAYLKTIKTDKKQWKNSVRHTLLSQKVVGHISKDSPNPTPEEIQEFYTRNPLLFKKSNKLLIRHFFHTQKEIAERIKNLSKQRESFKTLVEQFSQVPPSQQLKWVKKENFPAFNQIFPIKKGDISPILSTPHGYHIVEIIEKRRAKNLNLKEAQKSIIEKLKLKKQKALFKDWLDKEGKKVHISKDIETLKQIKIKPL